MLFRNLFFVAFFIFAMTNLVWSQNISPVFFQMVDNEEKATPTFLAAIRRLPPFLSELMRLKSKYGTRIEEEVFRVERARKKNIIKLESALKETPSSRDLLFNLSILYREAGEGARAEEYLRKARETDPTVK